MTLRVISPAACLAPANELNGSAVFPIFPIIGGGLGLLVIVLFVGIFIWKNRVPKELHCPKDRWTTLIS